MEIIELLIHHGADINSRDGHKMNSLVWAAHKQDKEIVSLLLSFGADLNSTTLLHSGTYQYPVNMSKDGELMADAHHGAVAVGKDTYSSEYGSYGDEDDEGFGHNGYPASFDKVNVVKLITECRTNGHAHKMATTRKRKWDSTQIKNQSLTNTTTTTASTTTTTSSRSSEKQPMEFMGEKEEDKIMKASKKTKRA